MFYIKRWIADGNYVKYNFWHTDSGPVIFRQTKDKSGEAIYEIMNPLTKKYAIANSVNEFKLIASEMLAMGFGWRKDNDTND